MIEAFCIYDTESCRNSDFMVSDFSFRADPRKDESEACSGINLQILHCRLCFLLFYLLFNASLVAAVSFSGRSRTFLFFVGFFLQGQAFYICCNYVSM